MKKDTANKVKYLKLKEKLGFADWQTKGVLQSLWDFTSFNAYLGDIGRHSNADIALGIGWPSDQADDLIDALTETGWLDVSEKHRLVVHDWHDHAEDWVKKKVRRADFGFASEVLSDNGGQRRTTADNGGQRRTTADNGGPRSVAKPSVAKPILPAATAAERAPEEKPPRKPRAPDPIWDTVVELFHPSGVPVKLKTKIGAVVRDLKALGATAAQIRERYDEAGRQWSRPFGPEALVNRWDILGRSANPPPTTPELPPPPPEWIAEQKRLDEERRRQRAEKRKEATA